MARRNNPEQFQLRLPTGLRARIKAYADRHNRSMNAEIVRILEREFPETSPLDQRLRGLVELTKLLRRTDSGATVDELTNEMLLTIREIASGQIIDVSPGVKNIMRDQLEKLELDLAEQQELDDTFWLDEEEIQSLHDGFGTAKFIDPGGDLDDEEPQQ